MTHCNSLCRIVRALAVLLLAAGATFGGCTTSDDTLGAALRPDDEGMRTGMVRLGGRGLFETRLYRTDSVRGSNVGYGYFGSSRNDTTGLVESGFLSQYLSGYLVDDGYFGYRPIFDSAQIHLAVKSYGCDTITPQRFLVYEVTDDSFIAGNADSVFYLDFDPAPYIGSEPLFSFTFPQGQVRSSSYVSVRLEPTDAGRAFAYRLMISDGTKPVQAGVDYSVYSDADAFRKVFKGLCIVPAEPVAAGDRGSVFGADLASSGFTIYARNRVESDPTLIRDTVGATYYFSSTESGTSLSGNLSVNSVRHDYTASLVDAATADETAADRPTSSRIIVSGLGGVLSELTFAQPFFDAIEAEIARVNAEEGENYTTLAVNRALLTLYFRGADYDWTLLDPTVATPLMEASLSRLGSYTDYKRITGITDYDYYTEHSTEDYELTYGGYINRSKGCYELDISSYLQELWNSYIEAKEARSAESAAVDLGLVEHRTIYLGPDAYSLYTDGFTVVQGMEGDGNTAPLKIDLTYTLIR